MDTILDDMRKILTKKIELVKKDLLETYKYLLQQAQRN